MVYLWLGHHHSLLSSFIMLSLLSWVTECASHSNIGIRFSEAARVPFWPPRASPLCFHWDFSSCEAFFCISRIRFTVGSFPSRIFQYSWSFYSLSSLLKWMPVTRFLVFLMVAACYSSSNFFRASFCTSLGRKYAPMDVQLARLFFCLFALLGLFKSASADPSIMATLFTPGNSCQHWATRGYSLQK